MILTPAATAGASMSASAAGWTSARNAVGPTTKIHALVDSLGNPVEMMLTPGQAHDLTCTAPLLEECDPEALIGDTAYDADAFIDTLTEREITPVIPPCDFALYASVIWSNASSINSSTFARYRHPLRQTCQKFPRRSPVRLRYHPPQLKTGPSRPAQGAATRRPGHRDHGAAGARQ
jgi:transposase